MLSVKEMTKKKLINNHHYAFPDVSMLSSAW